MSKLRSNSDIASHAFKEDGATNIIIQGIGLILE